MTSITIIGTGNMGQAIADLATKGGHSVQVLDRDTVGTPATGDIVVLATPYGAVTEVLAQQREHLTGKVLVDISNPVDKAAFDGLVVPADASAAAEIAASVPAARVLKAFNTNFAATLAAGTVGALPTTVLIAGDDGDAKAQLAQVVTDGGLNAVDTGSLRRARELEAIGFLQLTLAVGERISWTGGFAAVA